MFLMPPAGPHEGRNQTMLLIILQKGAVLCMPALLLWRPRLGDPIVKRGQTATEAEEPASQIHTVTLKTPTSVHHA